MHALRFHSTPLVAPVAGAAIAAAATFVWNDLHAPAAALLAALFVGAAVPFAAGEVRRFGLGSPALLLVVGLAYYHLIIPVEYLIDPALPRGFLSEYGSIVPGDLVAPLGATDAALFAFLAGHAWTGAQEDRVVVPQSLDARRLTIAAASFAGVGAALYLAMSWAATGSPFGIFSVSYRDRDELFYGLGTLAGGLELVYVGLATLGISWLSRPGALRAAGAVAVVALMALHSFLVGSKQHVFHVGVALLVGGWFVGRRVRPLTAALMALVVAAPLLLVGVTRNRLGEGVDEMAEYAVDEAGADDFNPANIDAYGPYLTLIHTTATVQVPRDLRWGATYLQTLTLLPPRWMYPWRPLPISDEFAMEYLGKDYYDNAGFGYSAVTEAYVNFGAAGPVAVFFAFGVGLRALGDWLRRRRGQLGAAILAGTAAPWALIAVRYPLSGVVKGYGLMSLVPALLLLRLARTRSA